MFRTFVSTLLSLSLILGSFAGTVGVSAASGGEELVKHSRILAYYPLRTDTEDASGHGFDGVIKGKGATFNGLSMRLPGGSYGSEAAYVQLPTGLLSGQNTLTISVWVKDEVGKRDQSALFFGNNKVPPTRYWILNDSNRSGDFKSVITDIKTKGEDSRHPWDTEAGVPNSTVTDCTDWGLYTTVITPTTITGYYNGQRLGNADIKTSVSDLGDDLAFMIGRSYYKDPFFQGSLRDLIIYKDALTDDEVARVYDQGKPDGNKIIQCDENSFEIKDAGNVTADLQLPKKGTYGSDISWACEDPCIEIKDGGSSFSYYTGKVNRPVSGAGDKTVTLKAKFSCKNATDTKDYTVTVKELPSDDQTVQEDAAALVIPNAADVRGNITLPLKGSNGSSITWASTDDTIINSKAEGSKPAGIVHRPAADESDRQVTLTATVKSNDAVKTKSFYLTVKALPKKADYAGYLFAYFTGERFSDGEQIYFAASKDGLHWTQLNGEKPVLTSTLGEKGVRDPFIIRSAEGDKFYALATDLKIHGAGDGAWNKAVTTGSKSIMIWESTDLVHWSDERMVRVAPDIAGCAWAPEAFYDSSTGEYLVFWASQHSTAKGGDGYHRIYCSRTRDFYNFTEPEIYIQGEDSQGNIFNVIDATMLQNGRTYYRWFKNEDKGKKYVIMEKSSSLKKDAHWEKVDSNVESLPTQVEAPTCFKLNGQDKWCLMLDQYHNNMGYFPLTTTDLDGGQFTQLDSSQYKMPGDASQSRNPRHGTVIPVTQAEYDALTKAYGTICQVTVQPCEHGTIKTSKMQVDKGQSITLTVVPDSGYQLEKLLVNGKEVPVPSSGVYTLDNITSDVTVQATFKPSKTHQDPVLSYNFDEEQGSAARDISGNGRSGTLNGNAKYVMDSQKKSQVLYLDGSSSYLQFPTGFFDGRNTMTLSMDVKSESTEGNYFTAAIGTDDQKYYFLKTQGSDIKSVITTGSWKSEQGFTNSSSGATGTWMNLKVVITPTSMTLYQDGKMVQSSSVSVRIADLGSNLLAYLGKSFYSADNYFKGYFDNVKVYDRALTAEEIAKESGTTLPSVRGAAAGGIKFIKTKVDAASKKLTLYVRRQTDLTHIPLQLDLIQNAKATPANGSKVDLTKPVSYQIKLPDGGSPETWTVQAVACNNPVLNGLYADPDIEAFGGKYYMYPTTDGNKGWSGTKFKAFESNDLIHWNSDGVILDVATDVPWAKGSAWAPCMTEKNGKYYFYFCADQKIGVAVGDTPAGPFQAQPTPLITKTDVTGAGCKVSQTIDPSLFTDDDGKTYLCFGNGTPAIVQLNDNMISCKPGTMRNVAMGSGCHFRESFAVMKKDGKYHFTWSSNDTRSEDYQVEYGTSDSLCGPVKFQKTLLTKNADLGILATGHHSILKIPGRDEYYIAYHRFSMPPPDGVSGKDRGYNREVCLDKLTFGTDGLMNAVTPTLEGITTPVCMADKTALQSIYDEYSKVQKGNYRDAAWAEFTRALKSTKAVLDNTGAKQDQIDEAAAALLKAYRTMAGAPDIAALLTIYNSCKNIQKGGYTDASWSAFSAALKKAKSMLSDLSLTQGQIDAAAVALKQAFDGLVNASSPGGTSHHSGNKTPAQTPKNKRTPSVQQKGNTHFRSDTTDDYHFTSGGSYVFKITTPDTIVPSCVSSNPAAVRAVYAGKAADGYLFRIVSVGEGKAEITTTAGDGTKITFTAYGSRSVGLTSDTPYHFSMKSGMVYQFKFISTIGCKYLFTSGNSGMLRPVAIVRKGNVYYVKVKVSGTGSAGLYAALQGQSPTRQCVIQVK